MQCMDQVGGKKKHGCNVDIILGFILDNDFTEKNKIEEICSNPDDQNQTLREKIENLLPELKTAEKITEAYKETVLCLKERKRVMNDTIFHKVLSF